MLVLAVAGCATVPDLDRIDMRGAGATPDLLPLEGLLATLPGTSPTPQATDQLTDRATALRRRAADMQDRAGIDPDTRARMGAGVAPMTE